MMKTIKNIKNELSVHGGNLLISGPCSAESEEQLIKTALALKKINKVDVLRAGIWKPRTKPGNFEGVGSEALKWLNEAKKLTGLKTAVEVANFKHVYEALKNNVDILWIGARTTVNPFSVQEIADALKGVDATVLIKNPINPDLALWEGAIERMFNAGIKKIGVIHRGFSKFNEKKYRNAPQWHIPIEMKRKYPELLMICDPSHIAGKKNLLFEVAQEAMDLNFDGLMIESHINPSKALSDKEQQITPAELSNLIDSIEIRDRTTNLISEIDELRMQIDEIDDEILEKLSERMNLSRKIGAVKKKNKIKILQSNRWDEILNKVRIKADNKGLDKVFITKVYTEIHIESINIQNEIMNNKKWISNLFELIK